MPVFGWFQLYSTIFWQKCKEIHYPLLRFFSSLAEQYILHFFRQYCEEFCSFIHFLELLLTSGLELQFVFILILQFGHIHEVVIEITGKPIQRDINWHKLINVIIFCENKCIFSKKLFQNKHSRNKLQNKNNSWMAKK